MFVRDRGGNTCNLEPKEQSHWAIARYHLDGRMAQHHHHNPDGSEWTSTYAYDANGLLREVESRDATSSVLKDIYLYDQSGRLQSVVRRLADGAENTVQVFTYDGRRKTKIQYFHSTPESADSAVAYTVEGSDAAFSAPGATSITTVCDEQDRPSEALFHDSQHRLLSRVTLRYDDAGRMVEESQTAELESTFPPGMDARLNPAQLQTLKAMVGEGGQRWKRVHRYDAEGRRVETLIRLGALGGSRRRMTYNQLGDLSEEESAFDSKELSIDDQGRVVETSEPSTRKTPSCGAQFSYQYDEHGNWTERVISGRTEPDKPLTVSSMDRRSLTYHSAG
jgi:YD repeat-containing protein